ncbi:MAG: hypothetical protein V2A54_07405, partial [Bacteroidota bacterium]
MKSNLSIFKKIMSYASGTVVEMSDSTVTPGLHVYCLRGKLQMNSVNANYSEGPLRTAFEVEFRKLDLPGRNIKNTLILGFGAGSVASLLQEKFNIDCAITGVELDPEVIRLGEKYFKTKRF